MFGKMFFLSKSRNRNQKLRIEVVWMMSIAPLISDRVCARCCHSFFCVWGFAIPFSLFCFCWAFSTSSLVTHTQCRWFFLFLRLVTVAFLDVIQKKDSQAEFMDWLFLWYSFFFVVVVVVDGICLSRQILHLSFLALGNFCIFLFLFFVFFYSLHFFMRELCAFVLDTFTCLVKWMGYTGWSEHERRGG